MLALPQGMILVTGPTGSGKSTTLYSALNFVRKSSINIITVEDPVEYALPGLYQVQVNSKAGLTFSTCLRSILRQDPDVIMIGEIRDRETAEIALKAAQTGHLVLSTLHTNDSISAITRLLDLGVPAFQIAVSLTGVVAQRLVRRLCSYHNTVSVTPEYTAQLQRAGSGKGPLKRYSAAGCDNCDLTGYKGRVGVYEMLCLDEPIRNAIRDGGRTEVIHSLAGAAGMRLMHEYALENIHGGVTTLEEVLRVVPIENSTTTNCHVCRRELAPTFAFCPYCGERKADGDAKSGMDAPDLEIGVLET
jgi:type IV pilus assembly protein PilB